MHAPHITPGATPPHPPAWFDRRIRRGLAALMALRLEGHPAADTVEATARVWAQALWPERGWQQERDEPRIGEAFRRLALHATRWPAPAVFLRELPPLGEPAALPMPAPSPDQRQRVRELLAAARRRLTGQSQPQQ